MGQGIRGFACCNELYEHVPVAERSTPYPLIREHRVVAFSNPVV
jgi:hypothetical protein